jgi:hypothetical protein
MVHVDRNTPPSFLGPLKDIELYFYEAVNYTHPLYKDMENDVFIKAVRMGQSHLPYFIEFDETTRTFIIDPEAEESLIGEYEIEVTLKESTGYDSTAYNFTINIKEIEIIPDTYI